MLTGISLQAHPNQKQRQVLYQWMGCARFIWNAKCDEDKYLSTYARKYLSLGSYPPVDQRFSQYKDRDLSPWLFDCPSQILRNSASNWYTTYRSFLKGLCGKPKKKRKGDFGSIHLTRELFSFEKSEDGVLRLFIGSKKNNIGYLPIKNHAHYQEPSSLYIKHHCGKFCVSFCFSDGIDEDHLRSQKEHLDHFKAYSRQDLEKVTLGIDRGVKVPVQAG